MINMDKWNNLSEMQQSQIETVCGDNMRHGVAEGEAIQIEALASLKK